jgi:hypothetical protein
VAPPIDFCDQVLNKLRSVLSWVKSIGTFCEAIHVNLEVLHSKVDRLTKTCKRIEDLVSVGAAGSSRVSNDTPPSESSVLRLSRLTLNGSGLLSVHSSFEMGGTVLGMGHTSVCPRNA